MGPTFVINKYWALRSQTVDLNNAAVCSLAVVLHKTGWWYTDRIMIYPSPNTRCFLTTVFVLAAYANLQVKVGQRWTFTCETAEASTQQETGNTEVTLASVEVNKGWMAGGMVTGHSIFHCKYNPLFLPSKSVCWSLLLWHMLEEYVTAWTLFQFIWLTYICSQKLNKRLLQGCCFFITLQHAKLCFSFPFWCEPLTGSYQIRPALLAFSNQSTRDKTPWVTQIWRFSFLQNIYYLLHLTIDQLQCSWRDQLVFLLCQLQIVFHYEP